MPNACKVAPYLDIIAVDCNYKGNGLGIDLFDSIIDIQEDTHKLFWRSRLDRQANDWYMRRADGHEKYTTEEGKKFNLYWIGLTPSERQEALDFVKNRPSNFIE
jgi:acetylglutamate synthase